LAAGQNFRAAKLHIPMSMNGIFAHLNTDMLSHSIHILLLGSGAREHALAWAIKKSALCKRLFVSTGNAGTSDIAENIDLQISDHVAITAFIKDKQIDLLVIGPEQPLVDGLRDHLASDTELKDLMIIGPGKLGAQLEGSKAWSKSFMQRHNIPTADYYVVDNFDDGVQKLNAMTAPYAQKRPAKRNAGRTVWKCRIYRSS